MPRRKISQRAARRLQQEVAALRRFITHEIANPASSDTHCVGVVLDDIELSDYGWGKMAGVRMASGSHVLSVRNEGKALRVYLYRMPREVVP